PAINEVEDLSKVHSATITNWYEYSGENYIDTSVNINFDEIDIAKIDKVVFEIYKDNEVVGSAVSENDNLTTLLKDCAQYWDKTADTYLEVTGDRTMSCAFKTRTEANDNGYWVRSKCSLQNPELPTKLVVSVFVENTKYVVSSAK
ncbi:MAG: hypothetical protein ACI4TZ_03045, partial [Christensenellales bacterium]